MGIKVNKPAEKVYEDALKYHAFLTESTRRLEKELEGIRAKMKDNDTVPQKKRRQIQTYLANIKANHFKLDALEVIFKTKTVKTHKK
jgi:hypothetical protein